MKIPCKRCGKEFETNDLRKRMCCKISRKIEPYMIYLTNERSRFLNPKLQYFRLFHNEDISREMAGMIDNYYLKVDLVV